MEELAQAKKFFDAGLELSRQGLFQEALASFLEANRIVPRESIQNNLARTYRQLNDMANAYDAYETLLALYGDRMKPDLKKEAEQAIQELEALTGVISVGVSEPGAKVAVDGKDAGLTPLGKPLRVNAGSHQISITKAGFDPLAQTVEVHGHDVVQVNGPLTKAVSTGHVSVGVTQTVPPDPSVKIVIDGRDVGPPPFQGELDPGAHTLEAKGDLTAASPKQIQVEKKGSYTANLELHVRQGSISVNVDVGDSQITIDGKPVATGVFEGPEPAGTYTLRVTKSGYDEYKKELVVHDGERVVENVTLQKGSADSASSASPRDWRGFYAQINLIGQFELTKPSNDIAQGVGYTPATTVNGSNVYGGGLNIRVGYDLGAIGLEGSLVLGYDHSAANVVVSQSTVTHPGLVPRTENYDFHRGGGSLAVGVRLLPKREGLRPTAGIAAGVALKGELYERSIDSSPTLPSNPAYYAAPAFFADGGVEIGSTPGAHMYLGWMFELDVASATPSNPSLYDPPQYPAPTQLNVVNGVDLFFGPLLGVQLGQ